MGRDAIFGYNRKERRTTMPSYSPLLALVTGMFECLAAIYTFFSPGRKRLLYPVGVLFLLLAGYQFAEVAVCSNPENLLFTRLAFFGITWLPPLGIWIVWVLSAPKPKALNAIPLIYCAAAAGLSFWIFTDAGGITKSVCQTVIARYQQSNPFETFYGHFYQSAMAIMIFGAAAGMAAAEDSVLRKHLANIQVGVLGFVLPSLAVRILFQETQGMLPSVMCHFALVLAMSLCALVLRERRASRAVQPLNPESLSYV
jgi:hypothetical protein